MAPEFDHLGEALDEATVPIVAELRARLEVTPSEKDWIAIDTALAKAAVLGVKHGARELSEQVDEAIPPDRELTFDLELDCEDRWARRYGAARPAALSRRPGPAVRPGGGRSRTRSGCSVLAADLELPAVGELVQQQRGVFGVVGVPADRDVELVERADQLDPHDVLGHPDAHFDGPARERVRPPA